MSLPSSPTKLPWLNRQFNKLGSKMQKKHLEGKKNQAGADSACVPTGYAPVGREVGFSAFGDMKEVEVHEKEKEKDKQFSVKENEIPTPAFATTTPVNQSEEVAGSVNTEESTKNAGFDHGADAIAGSDGFHARVHGSVPYDGDLGKAAGNGDGNGRVSGGFGPHTALSSHPIAAMFRGLD